MPIQPTDGLTRVASTSTGSIALTATEHRLFRALVLRTDQVAPRRVLVEIIGPGTVPIAPKTVDSPVRSLRRKLALIQAPLGTDTVHRTGFCLVVCPTGFRSCSAAAT